MNRNELAALGYNIGMSPDSPSDVRSSRRLSRRLLFRFVAILLSLAPLWFGEIVLTALGWGRPSQFNDPYVGFSSIRPLFVLNESGTQFVIPPSRQKCFRPESFKARKPTNEFRIFCLGGSTVQGRPFAIETSFTTWLELSLNAADPSHRWEVVNCGGISYASYRLLPILKEVLAHQPDLIILYTGQNEFLEDRTYDHLKNRSRLIQELDEQFSRLRTYTLLREGWLTMSGDGQEDVLEDRPILPEEVDALLDYRGGLEKYHRDEDWRRGVIDHYEVNLRRMVALCRTAGVPVVLVNPVCNLETPPFKSEHRPGLTPTQRRDFDALWNAARRQYTRNMPAAIEYLRCAAEIDDRFAGLLFVWATCEQELGHLDEARRLFLRAKEEDVCPLRILEPMHEVVFDVAEDADVPLVDANQLFAERSAGGITGDDWLVDHVHPSIRGHQLLARALIDSMAGQGWVDPTPGWIERRDRLYAENLSRLDDFYYLKGEQRLKNLEAWAHGRATKSRHGTEANLDLSQPSREPKIKNS